MIDDTQSAEAAAPRPGAYRWYVLAVLTAIFTVHALDRQLITIVLEPIKNAFGLSDTLLGFLSGTVYAVSFSIAGIPGAMLVDRVNRRKLLSAAVALWSCATALSGFAVSYVQLVLARIGLAVCEAPSLPSSASIISDLFGQRERATAMGIYGMGLGLGQLVGFVVGGWIAANWGWREVFIMGGLPGLLLAVILVATVKEPARRRADGAPITDTEVPSLPATLRYILSQRSLVNYFSAYVLMVIGTSATMAFMPSFYIRSHGVSLVHIGLFLGVGFGLANVLGSFLGGIIADRLGSRDQRWIARLGAVAAAVVLVSCWMLESVESVAISVTFMVVWGVAFTTQIGPFYALSQSLVSARMRGTTIGTLNTLVNILAYGLGPLATGLLSDAYADRAGDDALRYALMTVACINVLAIIQFLRVGRTLPEDLVRAAAQ